MADRNLALELVRCTEAAALAASRHVGRGDKITADGVAVDAMREMINTIEMDGVVVIGEGEKDQAPMLFNGEHVGTGTHSEWDVAVDPIDGTRLTAQGRDNAISVIAVAERDSMFSLPGYAGSDIAQAAFYMEKLAVGREAAKVIDLNHGIAWNLQRIAEAKQCQIEDLTVCILERPRHEEAIAWIQQAGAAIHLIQDGDVAGALMAAIHDSGVDVLYGIGGTPEAVIAACGLKCMRGAIQAKFWSEDPAEKARIAELGLTNRIFETDDLVASDNVFFAATGVTDGKLLRGIRHDNQAGIITSNSLVMRSRTGTNRTIFTDHEHI